LHAEVDPLVQPLIDGHEMVGCVVGIIRGGEAQVLAYGETKKGSKQAPDGKTIYEIGSSSKAFTGVLLADAVNAGLVKLDDPLQKHVPKAVRVPEKDGKPITLEHLATHTSGLPRLPDNMRPKDPTNPYADYTAKQMADFLSQHKLQRVPGEYEYSNFGMGLLGHVLAAKQKTSYEKLLQDRIARPLGMEDTCITLTADQKKRLAPPYNASLAPDKNWDLPALAGAGAIRSTVDDQLKFLKACLATDDRPLSKAIRMAFEKRHTMKDGMAIGLGWHLARDGVTRWHSGMTGGYSSWISVVPTMNAAVVVLTNAASPKTDVIGEQLTRVACGIKVEPPKKREEIAVDAKTLKKYVGYYALSPDFGLTVAEEDGKLTVQGTGQPKLKLFAESKTKFFCKEVDAQIHFVANDDGEVNHLVLHQNGINQTGRREERKQIEPKEVDLQACVGVYAINPQFAMTVKLEDGKLSVQATNQGKIELEKKSPGKFSCVGVDAQITFVPNGAGKVTKLILHQNGIDQTAKRKK
jgi:CubicO group peptidase (beta-lactamase class C family)